MSEYAVLVEMLRKTCCGESEHITDLERRIAANAIEKLEAELEQVKAERDALIRYLAEAFESPCNFSTTDDEMFYFCGDDCGKDDIECWTRVAKMAVKRFATKKGAEDGQY